MEREPSLRTLDEVVVGKRFAAKRAKVRAERLEYKLKLLGPARNLP
jgi:hypothetical protein